VVFTPPGCYGSALRRLTGAEPWNSKSGNCRAALSVPSATLPRLTLAVLWTAKLRAVESNRLEGHAAFVVRTKRATTALRSFLWFTKAGKTHQLRAVESNHLPHAAAQVASRPAFVRATRFPVFPGVRPRISPALNCCRSLEGRARNSPC
jgi:hypothetical protein